jgi:arylsulfatase A-like enzyme
MNRRHFLAAMGTVAWTACAPSGPERSARRKPNIILIMADDLGYAHLGCYGQEIIQTPNLDRMAREGMRFTNAYAGCTVCAPSRSALLTGQHTGRTPLRTNSGGAPLPSDAFTFAEALQQAGYATGIFGKWGLGGAGTEGVPNRQGFDEFLGPLHQVHAQYYYPDHLWRNEERFPLPGNENTSGTQYAPDVMHEAALAFIRENRDQPFLLYVPSLIPHHEFQSPADTLAPYAGRFDEEPFIRPDRGFADQPRPAEHFAGMVARLDQHVGEILALLRELDLDEQTIVLFTSDNGSIGNTAPITNSFRGTGPLRGYKSDLYEGGIRVPLIARWPGKVAPGTVTDHVCASWDFYPTFGDLAGVDLREASLDGISLTPTLLGREQTARAQQEHDFLYWETKDDGKLLQAVRMGKWKGLRNGADAPLELYDLDRDIGETQDVASSNSDIVQRIEDYLATARTEPPELEEPGWQQPGM